MQYTEKSRHICLQYRVRTTSFCLTRAALGEWPATDAIDWPSHSLAGPFNVWTASSHAERGNRPSFSPQRASHSDFHSSHRPSNLDCRTSPSRIPFAKRKPRFWGMITSRDEVARVWTVGSKPCHKRVARSFLYKVKDPVSWAVGLRDRRPERVVSCGEVGIPLFTSGVASLTFNFGQVCRLLRASTHSHTHRAS